MKTELSMIHGALTAIMAWVCYFAGVWVGYRLRKSDSSDLSDRSDKAGE